MLTKIAYFMLQKKAMKNANNRTEKMAVFAYDDIGHLINLNGFYELEHLEILKEFLNRKNIQNKLFIDIGANIGNHTIYFQDFFDSIISIEASEDTYQLLRFNTKNYDNIQTLNIGASSFAGKLKFRNNKFNVGASRIVEDNCDYDFSIDVDKLDNIIKSDEKVNLIKIDVEGHELDALKGSYRILINSKPLVVFEQEPTEIKEGTSAVVEFLRSLGYKVLCYSA